jgi:hypothetical protein
LRMDGRWPERRDPCQDYDGRPPHLPHPITPPRQLQAEA